MSQRWGTGALSHPWAIHLTTAWCVAWSLGQQSLVAEAQATTAGLQQGAGTSPELWVRLGDSFLSPLCPGKRAGPHLRGRWLSRLPHLNTRSPFPSSVPEQRDVIMSQLVNGLCPCLCSWAENAPHAGGSPEGGGSWLAGVTGLLHSQVTAGRAVYETSWLQPGTWPPGATAPSPATASSGKV